MSRLSFWAPVLTIVSLPLALFWSVLFGGRVLYWGTPFLQFYEWRQLVVDAYRAGHFPLWNEALGCGAPLLANLQAAALYPLNVIYLMAPVEQAMGYSVVVHIILAGFFMYGFTRCIGLRASAALLASLAYMLSGFLVSRAQFLSMVNGAAWLPLLFWLTYRIVQKRRVADGLLLGLAIAVQLLAGHAQLWYYSLWSVGLYVLYLGGGIAFGRAQGHVSPTATGGRRVWTSWGIMLLALLVGLLAAAGQILPTAEMTSLSQRASGAGYEFAMNYSFWPWRLVTLLSPDFFGNPAHGDFWGYGNYWEDCGYIGLFPLLLGLAAVVIWLRRRRCDKEGVLFQIPFFALLAVVALVLALGKNLLVYQIVWRYVPGFGLFQAPSRFLYWYTFGMAVLGGIGFQYLSAAERWARLARYLMAIAVSVLLTVGLGWLFLVESTRLTFLGAMAHTAVLVIIAGILILLKGRWMAGTWRYLWNVAAVGFVALDLLLFGLPLNPTVGPELYRWESGSGSFVRDAVTNAHAPSRLFSFERFIHDTMFARFFRFDTFGPTDEAHLRALRETLLPNLAVLEGLESANNYDPLLVAHQQEIIDYVERAPGADAVKLLGMMNVQYVAGEQGVIEAPAVYADGVELFTNPAALPRAYVVHRSRFVPDGALALDILTRDDFDPLREVLLSPADRDKGLAANMATDIAVAPSVDVASLRYEDNRAKIEVTLSQPGYLVLTDTYYPSWYASVDGEERPILRANHAFRAVALPAGEHHVEFYYAPWSFRWGLRIMTITWVSVILGLAALYYKGLRRDLKSGKATLGQCCGHITSEECPDIS